MILKFFLGLLFSLGLLYIIWPGPDSIEKIPPLPNSYKSIEPGDTVQIKNVAAYYSGYWRDQVIDFYQSSNGYAYLNILGFKIPPIRLNHPPEEAFTTIRDQVRTTYLEELIYPFRDSLYINGFEPMNVEGKPFDSSSVPIYEMGKFHISKSTLRFYPSSVIIRVLIYFFTWISGVLIYQNLKYLIKK